jgi:hypothetical protein|uniref:hypothetical protein n=1 Tax=Streptomyces sp. MSC1_001 TaxID=2909263 RepID=UPI00202F838D|nr:hypothetical protein [Streptomyces sp. MSC1_001]
MRRDTSPLSRGPVPVQIGGRTLLLAWRPAAEWTTVQAEMDVLGFLSDEDRALVGRMILNGTVGSDNVVRAVHGVLETVTGRRWWEGHRLLAMSVQPEALGHLTLAGVDPWQRSAYEWCAATYALYTKHADEKERLKFDFQLSIPPRGYEDDWATDGGDDPEAVEKAMAGWMVTDGR